MTELSRTSDPIMNVLFTKVQFLPRHPRFSLPVFATPGSAGFDLQYLPVDMSAEVVLLPGERRLLPLGFAVGLPYGMELQLRPRSGLAFKQGITILNSPGTIDCDYRGDVGALLINHGEEIVYLKPGERVCQGILAIVPKIEFEIVDELPSTIRGSGGFGHSGQ